MIRKFEMTDTERVMRIWLNGNLDAHPFIAEDYWTSNYQMVQEQLSQAEVYVLEADGDIQGFIGVMDAYIAGIFVDRDHRSLGVGKRLLEYVKEQHGRLELSVYRQNSRAVSFYLREGFWVGAEGVDEDTSNAEYTMRWDADQEAE